MRKVLFFIVFFVFAIFSAYADAPDFKYSKIVLADTYVPVPGQFIVSHSLNEEGSPVFYILDEVDLGPGQETGVCWSEDNENDM